MNYKPRGKTENYKTSTRKEKTYKKLKFSNEVLHTIQKWYNNSDMAMRKELSEFSSSKRYL